MAAYYSEFDPKAAAWLRELIKQGHIADGIVDERDLWDVAPADLVGFDQVHLCAGIGVWSYALRRAGWPDDRPVWTGSFPCQPFSAAGKGEGFADERHLWPAGQWLIEQCRPAVVFGEQVASKDAEPWIDLVQDDLEAVGYAVGAVPFPSAGVGAPHIRDRLYWVADATEQGRVTWRRNSGPSDGRGSAWVEPGRLRDARRMVNSQQQGLERHAGDVNGGREPGWVFTLENGSVAAASLAGRLAHSDSEQQRGLAGSQAAAPRGPESEVGLENRQRHGDLDDRGRAADGPAGPTNGLWRDADWLLCRDGKWRPVEPGTFPLAHGAPARVGRLRGYGNAINAEAAVAWIESYLEATGERSFAGAEEAPALPA